MHPENLLYSAEHVWLKQETGGNVRLGITFHYQDKLKKIVYVDLPQLSSRIGCGETLVSLESSKTAVDLPSPVSGTVLEVNQNLQDKPGLVNKDPYGEGWMVLLKPDSQDDLNTLLSAKKYISSIVD